jgi:hypothetical protein
MEFYRNLIKESAVDIERLARELHESMDNEIDQQLTNLIKDKLTEIQSRVNDAFPALKPIRRSLFALKPGETPESAKKEHSSVPLS